MSCEEFAALLSDWVRGGVGNADETSRIGKQILVPLTTSLYVPGTIADTSTVIVDVGTGFYVEKVRPRSSYLI